MIRTEYKGEFSLGMEKEFGIDRYEWFENTWNLEPSEFIEKKDISQIIKSIDCKIVILTAAPKVWAIKVLDYIRLHDFHDRLHTGEPDIRKPNPLTFKLVCERYSVPPSQAISVGDLVENDILPAKEAGTKTILVKSHSEKADFCIGSLEELPALIRRLSA